jgi:hypothetical protein
MTTNDDAQTKAREIIQAALEDYASSRIRSYDGMELQQLLAKDILMFALRGVTTAQGFVENAFAAFESSSEEGMMGTTRQRIVTDLTSGAIDLSDMVLQRDNVLWVVEVKAQTNTITGGLLPGALRILKDRRDRYARMRAAQPREVRAVLGVMRGPSADRERSYRAPGDDYWGRGFTYRYIVGRAFWTWLTGWRSIESLVDDVEQISNRLNAAREEAKGRLSEQMQDWVRALDSDGGIKSIIAAVDDGKRPARPRRRP